MTDIKKQDRKELLQKSHQKIKAKKALLADLLPVQDLIEVLPYGLVVSADQSRPVMVFKDKEARYVLPVWLSPADASIAMSQNGHQVTDASPHKIAMKILKPLGISLKKCIFKEVRGHYQIVDLVFDGDERVRSIEARADESISFCLTSKAQFFASVEFMERCRSLEGEMLNAVLSASAQEALQLKGKNEYLN